MKKFLLYGNFFCLTLFTSSLLLAQSKQKKPNYLIIVSDDHAWQAIGAYGSTYGLTPQIDKLASQGAIFTNATVVNSLCGPSRAALLTGKFSHKNGFKDNHSTFDGSQDSFIKQLQQQGYQTAWIGKWHLESAPQGFDFWEVLPGQGQYYNPDFIQMDGSRRRIEGYCTDIITELSEQWLQQIDTSKPFCLVIGHKAPHRTWIPDTADLGKLDHIQFPLPANFYDDYAGREAAALQDMTISKTLQLAYDLKLIDDTAREQNMYTRMNEAQRRRLKAYYDPIRDTLRSKHLSGNALTEWKYQRYMREYLSTTMSLDRNIGRILDFAAAHGLVQNTMTVYTSDQGFYLGEHGWFDKRFMYEESFRTPLIIRYPGIVKQGTTISAAVMNIDLSATFLAEAGVSVPKAMQGLPLSTVLRGSASLNREYQYYHYYEFAEHKVRPHFGISDGRFKIIRFYGPLDAWELFDLQQDPSEMHNLAEDAAYQGKLARMKEALLAEATRYEDEEAITILRQGY